MQTLNPAAQAIIEALKDPQLTPASRDGLVAALQAVTAPTAKAVVSAQVGKPVLDQHRGQRIRLTKTAIETMPLPVSGERLVYDTDRPKLAVRLRPAGRSWIVMLWDRERRRRVTRTLGKCSDITPEQARSLADRLLGQVADGEDIRRTREVSMTLGELVAAWHEAKSKSTRTADEMRDKALDYLGPLAARPLSEVEREDIGSIHHHIATKARRRVMRGAGEEKQFVEVGAAGVPATADKWLAIMSSVYGWACANGLVGANPCKGIQKAFNAKAASRSTYLHGDTLLRFWKALEADPDADVRDALKVMLYTGQRKGNVLAMQWDHVDLAAARWSIPATQTKQRKSQTNALGSHACEILARRHEDAATQWVFPAVRTGADGEIGHMTESRPRDAWERIAKAAGIEGVRIHDLRHTAGSWLARLGANEAVRQKALGHQTPAMAARYSHLELDPVADAMQRMGDAITAAATKPKGTVRSFKVKGA
jgi:integrase